MINKFMPAILFTTPKFIPKHKGKNMKSNLVISHDPNDLTPTEAVLFQQNIDDGFIYPLIDINFKTTEFENFINDVKLIDNFEFFDYSKGKNNISKVFKGKFYRIIVSGNLLDLNADIYAISEYKCKSIWDLYLKNIKFINSTDIYMTSYYFANNSLCNNTREIKIENLDYITNKYYPYLKTDVMFDQFFTGADNILLCVGKPGVGKSKLATYALKYASENTEKLPYDKTFENPHLDNQFINVVTVKSPDVISSDQFWRELENDQCDFVLIDDLDYMLTKRDAEVTSSDDQQKNAFLNQILSFTDGIEKYKTKFIITTNQTYDCIDPALLRKGRLFDILELRELSSKEALNVWKDNNLNENDFFKIFTTDTVLPADLGSEIGKFMNKRIDNAKKDYLLEAGISKIQLAKRSKKIGI